MVLLRALLLGILAGAAAAWLCPAKAQQPVQIWTGPATLQVGSTTVTLTSTFQSVFAAASASATNKGRAGCLIVNNSATTLWIYPGAISGATTPKSISLAQNGQFTCQIGPSAVIQDQISVTGTTGAPFFAVAQ